MVPTAGFMASVTCGLTAEDRDRLRNPTLVRVRNSIYLHKKSKDLGVTLTVVVRWSERVHYIMAVAYLKWSKKEVGSLPQSEVEFPSAEIIFI